MEKKKIKAWLPFLFSLSMVAGMLLGYKMRDSMPAKKFFNVETRKPVDEILDLISRRYVDSVNVGQLADSAIISILSQLDPHSQYIPARLLQLANEDIAGGFYGIGVAFNIYNDTVHVISVVEGGPSKKAGLMPGDRIIKAGDSLLARKGIDGTGVMKALKGDKGTKVSVTILRDGQQKVMTVTRDIIPVSSIDASYMIQPGTGYIRLNKFSQKTYREFMEAMTALKKQGMTGLILDLRGNGGGVLDEAVEIADEFLSGDKLITYTEGAHVKRYEYRCRREGIFETGKLMVLADEGSASASEVLMGALQDWDRATIIGRQTFGKGLVQEQYELSDNSAVRLTVSRYYTPLGRSIQRSYAQGEKAYYEEIAHRFAIADSTPVDTLIKETRKKFQTKNGKTVYEGGGISPDYAIMPDTTNIGIAVVRLHAAGTVSDFGYFYSVQHRSELSGYKDPVEFNKGFSIEGEPWKFFSRMAAEDSVSLDRLSARDMTFLKRNLKLSLARQLFRDNGYFTLYNLEDATTKKALELLNTSK